MAPLVASGVCAACTHRVLRPEDFMAAVMGSGPGGPPPAPLSQAQPLLLQRPAAAPAGGLDGLAGEQQAAALGGAGRALVERAGGALAAGFGIGRLARIV